MYSGETSQAIIRQFGYGDSQVGRSAYPSSLPSSEDQGGGSGVSGLLYDGVVPASPVTCAEQKQTLLEAKNQASKPASQPASKPASQQASQPASKQASKPQMI